jgi:hypothetical protein
MRRPPGKYCAAGFLKSISPKKNLFPACRLQKALLLKSQIAFVKGANTICLLRRRSDSTIESRNVKRIASSERRWHALRYHRVHIDRLIRDVRWE